MEPIVAWLVAMIVSLAPPERVSKYAYPGHAETPEAVKVRYESIARDIVGVVFDPQEIPPYGTTTLGRLRAASLVVAVASMESGFAHDVDVGPCYRGPHNQGARCDAGKSVCLLQVRVGLHGKTKEGWTKQELQRDRKKCITTGLRLMKSSLSSCSRQGPLLGLAAYASGTCGAGHKESKARLQLAERLFGMPGRPTKGD